MCALMFPLIWSRQLVHVQVVVHKKLVILVAPCTNAHDTCHSHCAPHCATLKMRVAWHMTRMLLLCTVLHLPTQSSMPNKAKISTKWKSHHNGLNFLWPCHKWARLLADIWVLLVTAKLMEMSQVLFSFCQFVPHWGFWLSVKQHRQRTCVAKIKWLFLHPPLLQCIVMSGLMEGSEGCPVGCNLKGWWNCGKMRKTH